MSGDISEGQNRFLLRRKLITTTTMNSKVILLVSILVLVACILQGAVAKRIYVKQAQGNSASARQRIGEATNNIGVIRHEFPQLNGASFEVPDDFDITTLQGDPRFEHVEEVPQGSGLSEPNDPRLSEQWGLASIQMSEVWDIIHWDQTRLRNITLAICDSGFTFNHPDLDASRVIWQYNYVGNTYNATDDHYHGTHVAGIAAATTNNSVGVAGIAYGVNFMIGKVLDSRNLGYYDDWAKCMLETTDRGANIINLSVGGTAPSTQLEQAVNYATERGVLVVVAAGNSYNNGNAPNYPGAIANSFTIANLQSGDTRSPSSTVNSFVDVAAPGTNILNTLPAAQGYYGSLTGTSMSTPLVAGISALLMAAKPGTTAQRVRELLQNTAIDLGTPGKDDWYGYGKVNPLLAAKLLLNEPPVISIDPSYELVLNETFSLNVACSSVESFDSCVSLNATTPPSFMNITQISATELKIEATPLSLGSSQVAFSAVDTFDTVKTVTVTFTVPESISPSAPSAQSTPSSPRTPATSTPGSSVLSSASQLRGLGLLCMIVAVFA